MTTKKSDLEREINRLADALSAFQTATTPGGKADARNAIGARGEMLADMMRSSRLSTAIPPQMIDEAHRLIGRAYLKVGTLGSWS